jgi:hypothetical protein
MITAPLFRFLTNPGKKTRGHFLYSIGDTDTMLYVGRSLQPVKRLRHHITIKGLHEISTLGKVIYCNLPLSLSWQVQLYTLADCKQAVYDFYMSEQFHSSLAVRTEWYREYSHFAATDARTQQYNFSLYHTGFLSDAEAALVWQYTPCINVIFNTNKRPYPPTVKSPQAYFTLFPNPTDARTYFHHHLERTAYDAA